MGPALQGLDQLVRLPLGCGEQNMVLFAPNIFVLDYLTATRRLTSDIKTKAINHMVTGYQRELNYRHKDGSYSAFGNSDSQGSMWLTAFVVKSFAKAKRFINIDDNDLSHSIQWIVKNQLENGCFPSHGQVLHSAMQGGLMSHEHSLIPLTAYILLSLLEAGLQNDTMLITNALYCLQAEIAPTSYTLALFTYATALAGHPWASKYWLELEKQAVRERNTMYWEHGGEHHSQSINVEIAAYAVLALTELGGSENIGKALPIVRWITQQRNANGGFVSTQDTVVALQALAKYATLKDHTDLDMAITVQSDDIDQTLNLNPSNELVLQSLVVPHIPTSLNLVAIGDGCAVVQASLRYNVKTLPACDAFDLSVQAKAWGTSECNKLHIDICARYKLSNQSSNMAVLEVKFPSGYSPEEWSLQQLHGEKHLNLKRHDVKGNQINFYFTKLTNTETCFSIVMNQEHHVEDILPATAKLYDYYEPEMFVATSYTLHQCKVTVLPAVGWDVMNSTDEPEFEEPNVTHKEAWTELMASTPIVTDGLNTEFVSLNGSEMKPENTMTFHAADDPFRHFANVHHELDFPDGIEGNIAFTVRPPPGFYPRALVSSWCPKCYSSFPKDFRNIVCISSFVIRVSIKSSASGRLKITHDMSKPYSRSKHLKTMADYSLPEHCSCPAIMKDGNVNLVVGTNPESWGSTRERHHLTLDGSIYVIQLPTGKGRQPQQLIDAKRSCS